MMSVVRFFNNDIPDKILEVLFFPHFVISLRFVQLKMNCCSGKQSQLKERHLHEVQSRSQVSVLFDSRYSRAEISTLKSRRKNDPLRSDLNALYSNVCKQLRVATSKGMLLLFSFQNH